MLKLPEGRQISQIAIVDVIMGYKNPMSLESISGIADVLDNDPDPFRNIHNTRTEHLEGWLII